MATSWLLCGLLALAAPARDPTTPPAAATAARVVAVGLVGDELTDRGLSRVLAGYLADLDPPRRPSVERLAVGDHDSLAQVSWARARGRDAGVERVLWLELRAPGPHRLYLYDPRADRVYLRELADADPDVLLESVGVVFRTLVASLSEGTPPGMTPVEAPAPVAAPTAAPVVTPAAERQPPSRLVDVMLGYRASSLAAQIPVQHGLAAQALLVTRRGALVGLTAGWLAPGSAAARVGDAALRLDVHRVPLALRAGYRLRRGRALHVDLDLGLTAELLLPRVRGATVLARAGVAARVGLAPGLGLGWHPLLRRHGVPLGVHVHLQLDVWLRDLALAVRGPAGDVVFVDAAPVGGTLDVALRYTFGARGARG